MQRLYAYAADSNLGEIEQSLVADFKHFEISWGVNSVRLRNVRLPHIAGEELPDWNIGVWLTLMRTLFKLEVG